jgi:peptide/nickel transport system substrate-binding protein
MLYGKKRLYAPLLKDNLVFSSHLFIPFLLALSLCQCSPDASTKEDSTLHVIVSSSPESLDPRFGTSAVSSNLSQLVFSPLFVIGENLLPESFLAKDIEQINNVTYLVHLRSNLFFHDGTPLKAEDVVYTFSSLNDADVRSPHSEKYNYIQSIQALSEKTVQFILKAPYAPFLSDLAGLGIVSKKHCQNRSQICRNNIIGSGPYRLVQFDKVTDTITLQAQDQWFEKGHLLPRIEIRVVKDATTRLLELIKGKADFNSGGISPIQARIVQKYPEQLILNRTRGLGYAYLAINLRGPKNIHSIKESEEDRTRRALADVRVRKALALSIDVNALLKYKFHGMATRATGLIPPQHWAKSRDLSPLPYDPVTAKSMLDQAGFVNRGIGKGQRFKITISTSPDRFRQSIALVYAQNFRNLGIETELRIKDFSALYQDIKQGNFEIFSLIWTPVIEPDLFHWIFHSSNIPGPDKGGGNRGAYIDPLIDELIVQARTSSNLENRKAIYEKIEMRLIDTMPYIPLWFEDEIVVMNRNIQQLTPSRTGSLLGLRHAKIMRSKGKDSL